MQGLRFIRSSPIAVVGKKSGRKFCECFPVELLLAALSDSLSFLLRHGNYGLPTKTGEKPYSSHKATKITKFISSWLCVMNSLLFSDRQSFFVGTVPAWIAELFESVAILLVVVTYCALP